MLKLSYCRPFEENKQLFVLHQGFPSWKNYSSVYSCLLSSTIPSSLCLLMFSLPLMRSVLAVLSVLALCIKYNPPFLKFVPTNVSSTTTNCSDFVLLLHHPLKYSLSSCLLWPKHGRSPMWKGLLHKHNLIFSFYI